jgi:hypothetical protein
MAHAASSDFHLALGASTPTYSSRFQWMAPVLIGLSAPLLFAVIIVPTLIDEARGLATVALITILFLCAGIFIVATLVQGDAIGAVVKPNERVVEVSFENLFSTRVRSIPFNNIQDIRSETRNDRDGYSYTGANIELVDGSTIALIASLTADEVSAARRTIGIRGRAR